MANPNKVIDIDKQSTGDLVLKIGKGKARPLRVHTNVLKMASPVFRAMFGPNFAEGEQKYDENNPMVLEDDDPRCMKYLLRLLHHQDMSKDLNDLSWAPGLVLAADKYDCIASVKPLLSSAIAQLFGPYYIESADRFEDRKLPLSSALCISYIIGDALLFSRTTRRATATIDHRLLDGEFDSKLLNLMPEGLLQRLEDVQLEDRGHLVSKVKAEIEEMFKPCHSPCDRGLKIAGMLQYKCWLWENLAGDYDCYDFSLQESWWAIERIAHEWEEEFKNDEANEGDDCGCKYDFGKELRMLVQGGKRCSRGFCLEFEKSGEGKMPVPGFERCGHEYDH